MNSARDAFLCPTAGHGMGRILVNEGTQGINRADRGTIAPDAQGPEAGGCPEAVPSREDEIELHPDRRFDELGWEIFLLAYSRGGDYFGAAEQAMNGNLHQRTLVRDDLLARWARTNHRSSRTLIS